MDLIPDRFPLLDRLGRDRHQTLFEQTVQIGLLDIEDDEAFVRQNLFLAGGLIGLGGENTVGGIAEIGDQLIEHEAAGQHVLVVFRQGATGIDSVTALVMNRLPVGRHNTQRAAGPDDGCFKPRIPFTLCLTGKGLRDEQAVA